MATSLKFEGNVAASIQGDSYKVGLESGILGVGFEAKIGEEKNKIGIYSGIGGGISFEKGISTLDPPDKGSLLD